MDAKTKASDLYVFYVIEDVTLGLSKPVLVVLCREAKQLGLEFDQDGIYEDRKEIVLKKLIDDVVILINPVRGRRMPEYSRAHPIVPKMYVPSWKTDMQNRGIITENAGLGGVPNLEHDENLFLEKREQMHYNVEDWNRVQEKIVMPSRAQLLRPDFHHETSRYQSELMMRRDEHAV